MVKLLGSLVLILVVSSFAVATIKEIDNLISVLGTIHGQGDNKGGRQFGPNGGVIGGCPLCDSSVYSYCSYKLAHDGCCCGGQYGIAIPAGCQYSDCQILYAKSCYEHHLIRRCCCENPYQK